SRTASRARNTAERSPTSTWMPTSRPTRSDSFGLPPSLLLLSADHVADHVDGPLAADETDETERNRQDRDQPDADPVVEEPNTAHDHGTEQKAEQRSSAAAEDGFDDVIADRLDAAIAVVLRRHAKVVVARALELRADLVHRLRVLAATLP